jgi:hypothetical protein
MIAKIALYPYHKPKNRNRQRKRPINRKNGSAVILFVLTTKKGILDVRNGVKEQKGWGL